MDVKNSGPDSSVEPRSTKRGGGRRGLLGFALAIVAIFSFTSSSYLSTVWAHASHLRMQRLISHQELAAGTIIYTEEPAHIAVLPNNGAYRSKHEQRMTANRKKLPRAWERAYESLSFEGWDDSTNQVEKHQVDDTFGHALKSSGGVDWILSLDQVNAFPVSEGRRKITLTQQAFRPVGWSLGSRGKVVSYSSLYLLLGPSDVLTVWAPQAHPEDGSRVTVPYEINGQAGVLDGVISDNGYCQFSVRTGEVTLVKGNFH